METHTTKAGQAFTIRAAELKDLDRIGELWWRMMIEHEARDPDFWGLVPEAEAKERFREWIRRRMGEKGVVIRVAEQEGLVAGFIHGADQERPPVFKRGRSGKIEEVAVDPLRRGQGIGKALIKSMLSALSEKGLAGFELMVDSENPAAQRLYAGLGFKPRQLHLVKKPG